MEEHICREKFSVSMVSYSSSETVAVPLRNSSNLATHLCFFERHNMLTRSSTVLALATSLAESALSNPRYTLFSKDFIEEKWLLLRKHDAKPWPIYVPPEGNEKFIMVVRAKAAARLNRLGRDVEGVSGHNVPMLARWKRHWKPPIPEIPGDEDPAPAEPKRGSLAADVRMKKRKKSGLVLELAAGAVEGMQTGGKRRREMSPEEELGGPSSSISKDVEAPRPDEREVEVKVE
jgi:hypothetical protein